MMDTPRDLILKSFLVESAEGLAQMEQCILELEARPADVELVQTIFRVVHTMKGNAGILELHGLLSFTHSAEDLLDAIRKGDLEVAAEVITLLLGILDVLREMVDAAKRGADAISQGAKDLLDKISGCLEAHGHSDKFQKDELTKGAEVPELPGSEAAPKGGSSPQKEAARTLRVDVDKLDRLLDLAGEITVARGRVAQLVENKEESSLEEIAEALRFADGLHVELQETILKTRMVPVGPLFRQFNRTVRDVAASHGKFAKLRIEGEEVEVDTTVVEHLRDPLLHMIRNALDHGIESPEARKSKDKLPVGMITLRAAHEGGSIVVQVSDDGAGMDRQRIIEVGQKRGLITEAEKLSDNELCQLIFESGFSTAAEVNDLSGRGVGMDVVRRNVQALRGTVQVTSEPGAGTTIHVRLPLTLAIIDGFAVGVGEETYVVPMEQVLECVELPADVDDRTRSEGIVQLRGEPLPFLCLREHFDLCCQRGGRQNVVVVQDEGRRVGLVVDVLHGATQTVIKPLPPVFKNVPGVSGSAILGNGRVALILDVRALLRDFRAQVMQEV